MIRWCWEVLRKRSTGLPKPSGAFDGSVQCWNHHRKWSTGLLKRSRGFDGSGITSEKHQESQEVSGGVGGGARSFRRVLRTRRRLQIGTTTSCEAAGGAGEIGRGQQWWRWSVVLSTVSWKRKEEGRKRKVVRVRVSALIPCKETKS